jgi:hypothetical protein
MQWYCGTRRGNANGGASGRDRAHLPWRQNTKRAGGSAIDRRMTRHGGYKGGPEETNGSASKKCLAGSKQLAHSERRAIAVWRV